MHFQRELGELIQCDVEYYRCPTLLRLCDLFAKLIRKWEQISQQFMADKSGKHPHHQKSADTASKHTKAIDNDDNLPCQGCGRLDHRRETCYLRHHSDFNPNGDWICSASEIAIRAFLQTSSPDREVPRRVRLMKHLRAIGTKIAKTTTSFHSTYGCQYPPRCRR